MLSVALLGFGTVGRSVARILGSGRHPELRLSCIFNRNVARKRADWTPPRVVWTERIEDVFHSGADVVVEVMGGLEPARTWIERALESRRSVVTANKQVIAECAPELRAVARRASVSLRFEAAVAGGVPVITAIEAGLAGDDLVAVRGVVSGTCNYILGRMEAAGVPFDVALGEAQALGYAEADPSLDIDGLDARAKLAILTLIALRSRVRPDRIATQSLRGLEPVDFTRARRVNCTIRHVVWAERPEEADGTISAGVGPVLVPLDSDFARVDGSRNLVTVRGGLGGETSYAGFGAGGDPTAVAVVSDLLAIAHGAPSNAPAAFTAPDVVRSGLVAPHYVRLRTCDGSRARQDALRQLEARGLVVTPLDTRETPANDGDVTLIVERCLSTVLDAALADVDARVAGRAAALRMPILGREDAPRAAAG
ncbi:MAG: homoserine dehydrogenase [Vicinamibacterales bacterium]